MQQRTTTLHLCLPLALLLWCQNACIGTSQLQVSGSVSGNLTVGSSGRPQPPGVILSGGQGGTLRESAETLDYGDLTAASGEPVAGAIGVKVRGNTAYRLNISRATLKVNNMRISKKIAAADQGGFISIRATELAGSGSRANVQGSRLSSEMLAGNSLANISQGPVSAQSTLVCSGEAPSLGGNSRSADNAVEVTLQFAVPSGLDMGPDDQAAKGDFNVTVEVGAFAAE